MSRDNSSLYTLLGTLAASAAAVGAYFWITEKKAFALQKPSNQPIPYPTPAPTPQPLPPIPPAPKQDPKWAPLPPTVPYEYPNDPYVPPSAFKQDPVVMFVQRALNDQQFKPVAEDGNWGPQTSLMVKRYQTAHGFEPTATITEETLATLADLSPSIERPMGPPPPTRPLA